mgnify:CR=1 FL=1
MGMLDGVKVLDFTHAYAGPFCTMTMADFGAQVIKIEKVSGGDQARSWGPFKNGYSGYYASFNRGKKSLPLDLRAPEAKEIIRRLIAESDIICSNFKAGTLEKMGFSYEEVRKIKPDIIYAELSGFGNKGALSAYAAYDNVMQAVSGVMDLNGFPDGVPQKIGPAIGDSYSGLVLLLGITISFSMKAEDFVRLETLMIMGLGLVAFVLDSVVGVLFVKLLNIFTPKNRINPMIGAAGISAFPMSSRVIEKLGQEADRQNHLLMYAIAANVSGQIASVVAGGVVLQYFANLG